jgi:hypothetical protein
VVIAHRRLHAIAVVRVDVQIEHPLRPAVEQRQDRQRRIVEIAKAAGLGGPAVMGAASRVVDYSCLGPRLGRCIAEKPRGQQRAATGRRRSAEDLRKDRIAVAPQAIAPAGLGTYRALGLCVAHGGDVVACMKARELIDARHGAIDIARLRQPPQRPAQVDDRRDARDRQRMLGAIARSAIDLAADEKRRHLPCLHPALAECSRRLSGQI